MSRTRGRYLIEVWSDERGFIQKLLTIDPFTANGGAQSIHICRADAKAYLLNGTTDDCAEYRFFEWDGEGLSLVRTSSCDADRNAAIDEVPVSQEEYPAQDAVWRAEEEIHLLSYNASEDRNSELLSAREDLALSAKARPAYGADNQERIMPKASFQDLTKEDLEGIDPQVLKYAGNEIYVFAQESFSEKSLQRIFLPGAGTVRLFLPPGLMKGSILMPSN